MHPPTSHTVKICFVYLHLPWLETPSVRHESKIKVNVEKCLFAVKQRVIFTSLPFFPAIKKDMLPASLLSNVVYNFLCHCDNRYVGRTSQRLQDRIRQHISKFIRTAKFQTLATSPLVLANLQPQLCLVNPRLANTF